ncbi:MAG: CHAD domain-containing protein [Methanolobus sp.]|nr:CHAD domain-containing protein [Methanolobus sp.]
METKETEIEDDITDVGAITTREEIEVVTSFVEFVSMKKTNINADDTMREAARKLLMFHFGEMVKHERGTKVGKDIEELHDMRVAAMRMRSVVEVLERYLDMDEMSSHYKNIRSTRKVLGTVRDLDVFLEKIDHYLEGQAPEKRLEMDPLADSILIERAKNRGNMLVYLDDARYNKFKKNFADYLSHKKSWKMRSIKDGEPIPRKVKDVLPVLLYEQFATVRAYDELVSGEAVVDPSLEKYHLLRIDVKILRYTLEFFREVLGSESKDLIKDLKALQDNLGDMHDTVVALELLENFEKYGRWGETGKKKSSGSNGLQDYPGIDAYIEYREQELHDLLEAFPAAWAKVIEPDFSVRFSQAISGIYTP